MLNENAKLWVEALRSGKYKQVCKTLHTKEGFCCLGIACALYQEKKGDLIVEYIEDNVYGCHKYSYSSETLKLPNKVRDWLELEESEGQHINTAGIWTSLSWLNDNGTTFEEIADIIESEPHGMFKEKGDW